VNPAAAELYRRHHRTLERAVSRAVDAPRELIEDACQNAWTILLGGGPRNSSLFGWLYLVATREADRLRRAEHRYVRLEPVLVDRFHVDDLLDAREALATLARLPQRQREDLALAAAGFSYEEIGELTGRTFNTVRKNVDKARVRVRQYRP
jgi:RNA polymerase sigma-70 factor, ECF subfamily